MEPWSPTSCLLAVGILSGACSIIPQWTASWSFCRVAIGFSSHIPSISWKITQTTIVLFSPIHSANSYLNLLTMFSSHISCAQLHPTPCDPLGCSPPGCSVHGISQARILEWVAVSSSRGSSRPRDQTHCLLQFLHCRQVLYPVSHQGSLPCILHLLIFQVLTKC